MDIIPGVGIGVLRFGMRPVEVKKAMGVEPKWEKWMNGNRNDGLCYRGLIMSFSKHDAHGPVPTGLLIEFEARNAPIFFDGVPLESLTRTSIQSRPFCGSAVEINKVGDAIFADFGIEIGFEDDGSFHSLQMWRP